MTKNTPTQDPSAKPKGAASTSAAAPKKRSTSANKAFYDRYKEATNGAHSRKPHTSSSKTAAPTKTNDTTAVPKSNTKPDPFRSDLLKRCESHVVSKKSERK
jgi:hypothetical protein